jgi:HK97 family phage major capsid protein
MTMLELDELARRFDEHHTEVKGFFAESEKGLKGVNARLGDIEQKMVRRHGAPGGGDGREAKSLGAALVEHPEFARVSALASTRGKITLELKTITSIVGSGAALVAPDFRPDPVLTQRRRLFVRDLVAPGATVGNAVFYPRQTLRSLNSSVVSEGTRKPESNIGFDIETAPVRTLAHFTKTSRQILDDAPVLQSTVDSELRYGLGLNEEAEMIFGDGTGQHILGVVPQSTAYETSRNVGGDTKFDTVAHAIAQSEVALLPATGIVMNTNDLEGLKVVKDTLGRYIASGGPFGPMITSLWGRPVVGTLAMPVNQFLVGAFLDGATIYDRQGVTVLISTENEDDFVNNKVTILCEERLAFAVRRPQAFIYGVFP